MWSRLKQAAATCAVALTAIPSAAVAQDGNIIEPIEVIEQKLLHGRFDVVDFRGSRMEGDRTNRAALTFEDGSMMVAKWASAARGADAFNNQPRYDAAAYELQKLFLDEADYVVPPTILRAFSRDFHETVEPGVPPTFDGASSVLVVLQYWLYNVTDDQAVVWDEDRLESDAAYARHFADANIFTYLIRHNDSNRGNLLISRDSTNPRVFAVDNGLAFSNVVSDRGTRWRSIRVKRLPRGTVERLRQLTHAGLTAALETVAQFTVGADGSLERVPVTENLSPGRGIRRSGNVIQLGLTGREIRGVWQRLERLLAEVDEGDYTLF